MADVPSSFSLVLMIDRIAVLPEELQSALLIFFRSLHANRLTNALLRKLSVVILSTQSLTIKHLGDISPYNISCEYLLPDLTREEVGHFVNQCQELLNGIHFTPEAVDYLFQQTEGHAILIQKICESAVEHVSSRENVTIRDILAAVVDCCIERRASFISRLLARISHNAASARPPDLS